MKIILMALCLLSSLSLFSQVPIEVQSLNNQSCWFHKSEQTIKFANFSASSSITYKANIEELKESIHNKLQSILDQNQFDVHLKGNYEVHLNCDPFEHHLVIKAYQSEPAIVFVTKFNDMDKGILLASENQPGYHLGFAGGQMVFKRKNNISNDHFRTLVTAFIEQVESVSFFGPRPNGRISLRKGDHLKTLQVKEQIESHQVLKHYTEYIEVSPAQVITGDHSLILKGEF